GRHWTTRSPPGPNLADEGSGTGVLSRRFGLRLGAGAGPAIPAHPAPLAQRPAAGTGLAGAGARGPDPAGAAPAGPPAVRARPRPGLGKRPVVHRRRHGAGYPARGRL